MFSTKSLQNSTNFLKRDAVLTFNKFKHLINWRKDKIGSFIDVGCATGDLIRSIILPNLPRHYKKVVGVDISNEMLQLAREHVKHPNVSFYKLDISKYVTDKFYLSEFEHVTAFSLLHQIPHRFQEMAIYNIYRLLSNNGDIILTIPVSHPSQTTHLQLENHPRWGKYIGNAKELVSPYFFAKDPKIMLKNYLTSIGFKCCEVHLLFGGYPMLADTLRKLIYVSSPIIENIPMMERDDYVTDFIDIMQLNASSRSEEYKDMDFVTHYSWLMAYARK